LDGTELVIRDDDREEVIRERLDAYERQTRPVLEFFRKLGHRVVRIEARDEPPEMVYEKIRRVMEPA
jgi:adenylate kinase